MGIALHHNWIEYHGERISVDCFLQEVILQTMFQFKSSILNKELTISLCITSQIVEQVKGNPFLYGQQMKRHIKKRHPYKMRPEESLWGGGSDAEAAEEESGSDDESDEWSGSSGSERSDKEEEEDEEEDAKDSGGGCMVQ